MPPSFAEHPQKELGRAVGDDVRLVEARPGGNEHGELHDPLDPVQPSRDAFQLAQQVASARLRALDRVVDVDVRANQPSRDERAILARRDLSGHVDEIADDHERLEGQSRHRSEPLEKLTDPLERKG